MGARSIEPVSPWRRTSETHPEAERQESAERLRPDALRWNTVVPLLRWSLVRLLLLGWGMAMVIICAYLLGGHLLTLPAPELDEPRLRAAMADRQPDGAWFVLHVLYGDCGCSRRVVRYLTARGPSDLCREHILLVEPKKGDKENLEKAGLTVEVLTRESLYRDFAISAAPLLVVANPEGDLRYVGGYTDRKRGPQIEDLRILRTAQNGQIPAKRPVFGCATNTRLAQTVDPLGLR